jgi:hypothetical protein
MVLARFIIAKTATIESPLSWVARNATSNLKLEGSA